VFVDASAMVAILLQEAGGERLAEVIDAAPSPALVTNVIAVWETVAAIYRKKTMPLSVAEARVEDFLAAANIQLLAAAPSDLALALAAFDRYGRHRYANAADRNKGLNLADCFHYACAKSRNVPILTTDEGFALTDLPKAS
jgi:ribonuclease VapC